MGPTKRCWFGWVRRARTARTVSGVISTRRTSSGSVPRPGSPRCVVVGGEAVAGVVGPLAVDPHGGSGGALELEPERLDQADRGQVARIDGRLDAVHADDVDEPVDHRPGRLGGQAATLERGAPACSRGWRSGRRRRARRPRRRRAHPSHLDGDLQPVARHRIGELGHLGHEPLGVGQRDTVRSSSGSGRRPGPSGRPPTPGRRPGRTAAARGASVANGRNGSTAGG